MTINEAIRKLEKFRAESQYGGDTNLVLTLLESGVQVVEVDDMELEQEPGRPGAAVHVLVRHPDLIDIGDRFLDVGGQ